VTHPSSPYGSARWWSPDDTASASEARQQAQQERQEAVLGLRHDSMILGHQAELDGLTAKEIESLPMADFGRLRERAGLPAYTPPTPADEDQADAGTQATTGTPSGDALTTQYASHSVESMDWQTYADYRRQLGLDRPGKGLFD
jgi:hypothetical protein